MNDTLALARSSILAPVGLGDTDLDRLIGALRSPAIDAADIYFQSSRLQSWVLEDGIIKDGSFQIDQGAGVRAIAGEKTGFAYSDELQLEALEQAASTARAIAGGGQEGQVRINSAPVTKRLYEPLNPILSLTDEAKVELLHQVDAEARRADPRVSQVVTSLVAVQDTILVLTDDGRMSADVRPLVRLNVNIVAEQDGRREQGHSGGGARQELNFFLEQDRALGYAREAVRQALVSLEAGAAPAGSMTVVLGAGWPGVLLHEAIGHGLEGDFNRKAPRLLLAALASGLRPRASTWSTTAPCLAAAAR
ncbi:MAG: hypothetical protein N838_20145 [Thiohalocapsa sp. PB-PSB1]|nr:MAG: hypothetical protein N838_20145 [Thiohalocapsa sp. PB-PSB1]